jgi:hypothetical protein
MYSVDNFQKFIQVESHVYSLIFFSILDPRDSEITRDTHSLMEEKS